LVFWSLSLLISPSPNTESWVFLTRSACMRTI
jgi:hypothetical protein